MLFQLLVLLPCPEQVEVFLGERTVGMSFGLKSSTKSWTENLGFHGENKICINRCLCQYYRMLWSVSRKLNSMSRIQSFYVAGESITIQVHESSTMLAIIHVNDFEYYFLGADLSLASTLNSGSWTFCSVFLCVVSFLYWVVVIYIFNIFVFWGVVRFRR